MNNDKNLLEEIDKRDSIINFWDFRESDTKTLTHGYHSYPAMMIPQLANEFIKIVKSTSKINNVFDPFMGSGTTLVEGISHGLDVTGTDLNPLSRLIARVKTNVIEPERLELLLEQWDDEFEHTLHKEDRIPSFKNIDFWFKDYVIRDLSIIKLNIENIKDQDFKDFVTLSFSETVRDVSNTRNNEFKLYRMNKESLEKWNPDVFNTMKKNLYKNLKGNKELYEKTKGNNNTITILDNNVMNLEDIEDSSFDLLVTSPPYGDSKTTVAYGQFSRLSNQWLDIDGIDPSQVDNELLGGRVSSSLDTKALKSETLNRTVQTLELINLQRSREVFQFFYDLNIGLKEITRVMRKGSYQFWVVGNRTVLKNKILTHQIIIELFDELGVDLVTYFTRGIPRKKMPSLNSPTNEKGVKSTTMNDEIIMVFRKK